MHTYEVVAAEDNPFRHFRLYIPDIRYIFDLFPNTFRHRMRIDLPNKMAIREVEEAVVDNFLRPIYLNNRVLRRILSKMERISIRRDIWIRLEHM